jgi:hypothetical protein
MAGEVEQSLDINTAASPESNGTCDRCVERDLICQ